MGKMAMVIRWMFWAVALSFAGIAFAHESGTSRFELDIGDEAIEAVFQFDVLTLLRIVPTLDRNRDGQVALAEVNAGAPLLTAYLTERVSLDIDGREAAGWGELGKIGWPNENDAPIVQPDYNRLLLRFPFRLKFRKKPKDARVTFDVFVEFGVNHRVFGKIRCDDETQVTMTFTHQEPDYLYDVAFARKSGD